MLMLVLVSVVAGTIRASESWFVGDDVAVVWSDSLAVSHRRSSANPTRGPGSASSAMPKADPRASVLRCILLQIAEQGPSMLDCVAEAHRRAVP